MKTFQGKEDMVLSKNISTILIIAMLTLGMVFGAAAESAFAFDTFEGKSPYSGVGYTSYKHNKDKFSGNVILNGVDVSAYQSGANSDWGKARNNGVDFAIIRISGTGYGSAGVKFPDSDFKAHYDKAKAAGLMVGVYVFSQAITETEAKAEAEYAVSRLKALGIGPKDLDMPVYMDYEFAGGDEGRMNIAKSKGRFSKTKATSCAKAFCETIKSYGYEPGIYANLNFLKYTIDGAGLGKSYRIWTAQYYNMAEFTGAYDTWQYSSAAKINGIYNSSNKKTSVDVNFWYVNPNRKSDKSNDLANCTVTGDTTVYYTGKQLKPSLTVKMDSKTLKKGVDYTIGYVRNVQKGTAYAYIRGIGEYTGYKLAPFTITDDPQEKEGPSIENLGISDFVKKVEPGEGSEGTGESGEAGDAGEGSESEGDEEYTSLISLDSSAEAAGYQMSDTELSGVIKGTTARGIKQAVVLDESCEGYTVHAISRIGEELPDTLVLKTGSLVDIRDADGNRVASLQLVVDGKATLTLSTTAYKYNGNSKKPGVTLTFGDFKAAEKRKTENDYMKVTYPTGTRPGTYTVTVKGKGCFDGAFTAKYKISIATTSLKSVYRSGKRSFKASWYKKSSSYVSGYQLQYSRRSDMGNCLRKTISKYSTGYATVSKRYSGYRYYVRVRTYKTISGKRYYSAWSSKKSVLVK